MKALVGAFNQEKALVGAFSVIVQPVVEPMEHYTALTLGRYSLYRIRWKLAIRIFLACWNTKLSFSLSLSVPGNLVFR